MLSTWKIIIQQVAWFSLLTLIHWIATYLVERVIPPSNNRFLIDIYWLVAQDTREKIPSSHNRSQTSDLSILPLQELSYILDDFPYSQHLSI